MDMSRLRVGVVQMNSGADPWENLLRAQAFLEEARRAECHLLCFPENVFYRGPRRLASGEARLDYVLQRNEQGQLVENTEFAAAFHELISVSPLWMSWGSVLESSQDPRRPFNAHWMCSPLGKSIVSYRKVHLFHYEGPRGNYQESQDCTPGNKMQVCDVRGFPMGLSICYDLRFPELYRDMVLKADAQGLLVPAAFTESTGQAHWHTLLRARAIENQCYVAAAAQWGDHENDEGRRLGCFGHALMYDPWGECLAEAPSQGDHLLVADWSTERLAEIRRRLPALDNAAYYYEQRL